VIAGACSAVLVILSTVDRSAYPEKLRSVLGSEVRGPLVPARVPLWHAAHFSVWIACGALVGRSVGAPWDVSLLIGGLLCVALVGGFVALLAPAGAGVREAILALGATPFLGPSAGVAVGVLARVVSLVSDVLLFVWFRWREKKQKEN
jgi:hypothetical protein